MGPLHVLHSSKILALNVGWSALCQIWALEPKFVKKNSKKKCKIPKYRKFSVQCSIVNSAQKSQQGAYIVIHCPLLSSIFMDKV